MLLPKEQGAQAGIDPKRHVYWNEPEKGLVGYPVRLEATHELHCLVGDMAFPEYTKMQPPVVKRLVLHVFMVVTMNR